MRAAFAAAVAAIAISVTSLPAVASMQVGCGNGAQGGGGGLLGCGGSIGTAVGLNPIWFTPPNSVPGDVRLRGETADGVTMLVTAANNLFTIVNPLQISAQDGSLGNLRIEASPIFSPGVSLATLYIGLSAIADGSVRFNIQGTSGVSYTTTSLVLHAGGPNLFRLDGIGEGMSVINVTATLPAPPGQIGFLDNLYMIGPMSMSAYTPAPEPATILLLGSGLLGLGMVRRRAS